MSWHGARNYEGYATKLYFLKTLFQFGDVIFQIKDFLFLFYL